VVEREADPGSIDRIEAEPVAGRDSEISKHLLVRQRPIEAMSRTG
jgi:hypothetical protein